MFIGIDTQAFMASTLRMRINDYILYVYIYHVRIIYVLGTGIGRAMHNNIIIIICIIYIIYIYATCCVQNTE